MDSPIKDIETEMKKRADEESENQVSDAFLQLQNIKPSYMEEENK